VLLPILKQPLARSSSIHPNDAMILPYDANPTRMRFSEGTGGLLLLVMNKVLRRRLDRADARRLQTIGDAMMLAGASLAVIAMLVGYFVSGEGP